MHVHQRKLKTWPALLLALFLLNAPLPALSASNNQDSKATEQQLKSLKQNIAKLQKWLNNAKSKRSKALSALRKSELEVSRSAKKIRIVTADINKLKAKLKKLYKKQARLQSASKKQAQLLAKQIRAAHSIGKQEYLKVLLNQEQPEQVARTLRYYEYFNKARTDQINNYKKTLSELQTSEQQITIKRAALQSAKNSLEEKQTNLKNNKLKRKKILITLESTIKNKGSELEKLLADRKQLEKLLKAVEETIAELKLPDASTPIAKLKGKLPWPTKGRIVRRFGSRDAASNTRWNGLIISAPEGKEVKAIHHGHVVFADWLRGFGLLVIIDHGKGYMSLYGHNQTLYKETGDWVNPNEVIASVGNSGGQKRSGLYFEIRRNGNPQNPQKWILARK